MSTEPSAVEHQWGRYPLSAAHPQTKRWIRSCALLGLADNTIAAYAYAMEDFLRFCRDRSFDVVAIGRAEVLQYLGYLRTVPKMRRHSNACIEPSGVLSNSTLHHRLTAVRLFFEFLVEEGFITKNPVARGRYARSLRAGDRGVRGLLPTFHKLPWIPSEGQWASILDVIAQTSSRNRCMVALAYDAALRREELCSLQSSDIDPAHRTLRIRAETTKGRRERVIPYSEVTGILLQQYLTQRRNISRGRGPLFLSESPRNLSAPITLWTWSKVIRSIALRAGVPSFSTHTLRHLCLTDLARAGWGLHEIARLAGHRSLETTKLYIHLSARDISDRFRTTMNQVHAWRLQALADTVNDR